MPFPFIRKRRRAPDVVEYGPHGGNAYHLHFEYRELPDAGAQQYANESLALPPYMPWSGITVARSFRSQQAPMFARQGVVVTGVIPKGQASGQFVTQPLLDPSISQSLGITPPAIANAMPTQGAF